MGYLGRYAKHYSHKSAMVLLLGTRTMDEPLLEGQKESGQLYLYTAFIPRGNNTTTLAIRTPRNGTTSRR